MTQKWKTMTIEEWIELSDEDLLSNWNEMTTAPTDIVEAKIIELYSNEKFRTVCIPRVLDYSDKKYKEKEREQARLCEKAKKETREKRLERRAQRRALKAQEAQKT